MFCGLCVEVCPYNALYMGRAYEQGKYSRRLLWADRETLMDPNIQPSAYGHPELEPQIPKQTLLVYDQICKEAVGGDD
jgi:formate hydrogenlyase subunit 6/NADH:ubiquinone oxidoreductase subunit I